MLLFVSCSNNEDIRTITSEKSTGIAYLYGEEHGNPAILNKEFELWNDYYHKDKMRHLFVEIPYYAAEYLNLWMRSDDNAILDQMLAYTIGTPGNTPETKEFYEKIKDSCPETVFHGVDVGHAYNTMGKSYLNYLSENSLQDTDAYKLTEEAIAQGKKFYDEENSDYRENMLVENFKREFDNLRNQNIMGIFGTAHTDLNGNISDKTVNMVTQLKEYYGENIVEENLVYIAKQIKPLRIERIVVNGKEYEAEYYGKQHTSSFAPEFSYREFWRLKDAFEDFSKNKTTGNVLPLSNYQMDLELNQIYIIDYTKKDGSIIQEVHRHDGTKWKGQQATQQLIIE